MLTLYEHPLSAYAMKVKMALHEKGLEFHALLPEGMANGTAGGAFVDASPRAEVPALVDGETKVFDSTNRSAAYGITPPVGSQLASWLARVNQRPAVAKVIDQMHQTVANLPDFAALLAQGKIKRQYRDHRLEWMIAAGGLSVVQEGIDGGTIRFSRLPG
jgi:glutathione S-transferase